MVIYGNLQIRLHIFIQNINLHGLNLLQTNKTRHKELLDLAELQHLL